MEFYPFSAAWLYYAKQSKVTHDFASHERQLIQKHPSVRMIIQNQGPFPHLTITDPALLKDFFNKHDLYTKPESLFGMHKKLIGKDGLFFAEGDSWKRHRKLLSQSFHYEFIREELPHVVEVVREMFDKLSQKQPLERVPMMDEFQKITGEVLGRLFFGDNLNSYSMDGEPLTLAFAKLLTEMSVFSQDPVFMFLGSHLYSKTPKGRDLMNRVTKFKKICLQIVNARKQTTKDSEHKDLLGLMLEQQRSSSKEDAFSDDEIVDEFASFFMAGMDTTGHWLALASHNILVNPEYLATVREEVDKLYKNQPVTIDSLNKMDFMSLVMKESLRYNTPVPILLPREALVDHMIGDIKVKKGTLTNISQAMTNFNPQVFENPFKFDPYRWLNADKPKKIDPFSYVPFSAGGRNCMGQHLAQLEFRIILSEFLARFDYQTSKGYQHKMYYRFLYEPEDTLVYDLVKRV